MHQPVTAPDLSRGEPATVSLRTGDRWIRVPADWAADHYYRHGQDVPPSDVDEARRAALAARMALRNLNRIRNRPMPIPDALAEDHHAGLTGPLCRDYRAGVSAQRFRRDDSRRWLGEALCVLSALTVIGAMAVAVVMAIL